MSHKFLSPATVDGLIKTSTVKFCNANTLLEAFDDILTNMNIVVNKQGVLQFMSSSQPNQYQNQSQNQYQNQYQNQHQVPLKKS